MPRRLTLLNANPFVVECSTECHLKRRWLKFEELVLANGIGTSSENSLSSSGGQVAAAFISERNKAAVILDGEEAILWWPLFARCSISIGAIRAVDAIQLCLAGHLTFANVQARAVRCEILDLGRSGGRSHQCVVAILKVFELKQHLRAPRIGRVHLHLFRIVVAFAVAIERCIQM